MTYYYNIIFMQMLATMYFAMFYAQFNLVTPTILHATNFGSSVVLFAFLSAYSDLPPWLLCLDVFIFPVPVALSGTSASDSRLVTNIYFQLITTTCFALAFQFQNRQNFLLWCQIQLQTHQEACRKEEDVRRHHDIERQAHFKVGSRHYPPQLHPWWQPRASVPNPLLPLLVPCEVIRSIAHDLRNAITARGCD